MKGLMIAALLGAAVPGAGIAVAQTAPPPQADSVLPYQAMRVGDLENREIYTPSGDRLGSVKRVVLDVTDGITFIVLERGGFVGIGEKEFPLPVERLYAQGGRLVVPGLTVAEIDSAADWDVRDRKYREMADSEIVNVARR